MTVTMRARLSQLPARTFALAVAVLASGPALAHHPMGGQTPSTLSEGLLSGLGHPILGLDHLAALIAVGLLASRFASGALVLPVLWIVGMALGAFAHMQAIDLPAGEILVAASLIGLGVLALLKPTLPLGALGLLFAAAGFAHGHALAESIIGADTAVVGAYLVGLVAIQATVTVGAILLVRRLLASHAAMPSMLRAGGAALAAIGVVFLVSALPGLA
jgi:urease accessory protein